MKSSLDHLPQEKNAELEIVRDIILDKVPDVRMIILFGSYARGDWVEDTHVEDNATHVYESDFDILVVTKRAKDADDHNAHDRVEKAVDATGKVSTPYSIIYHNLTYIQQMLVEGHYFFTDIQKEGIYLFRTDKHRMETVKTLPPQQRQQLAQEHLDQWLEKAKGFYRFYEVGVEENNLKGAAFQLHQATECLYSVITLVFINYRYRTHDLDRLYRKALSYDTAFARAFPLANTEGKQLFNLLRKAYIDARYKDAYQISKEQLEQLAACVKTLQDLTETICQQKIASFA